MRKGIIKIFTTIAIVCFSLAICVGCSIFNVNYKVEHNYETLSGEYEVVRVDCTADPDSEVNVEVLLKEGYEVDNSNEGNVLSGIATKDLVLKVFYNLVQYKIDRVSTQNGSFMMMVNDEVKGAAKLGQEVEIVASPKDGYDVYSMTVIDENGNTIALNGNKFVMPASNVKVDVVFQPENTVAYEVKHYIKDVAGEGFTPITRVYFVRENTEVTASPLNDAGYEEIVNHTDRVVSGVVTAENTLVLKLYYNRNSFAITTAGGLSVTIDKASAKVGETVNFTVKGSISQGYSVETIVQNMADENETVLVAKTATGYSFVMPSYSVVVKASSVANTTTPYKVQYYGQSLDDESKYELLSEVALIGTTDSTVDLDVKNIAGFEIDGNNSQNVLTNTVKGDGSLILKAYYTRIGARITFVNLQGETVSTTKVKYGANGVPAPVVDNYMIDKDTVWYWEVNGSLYDTTNKVFADIVVEQKQYDAIITTKAEFYDVFGCVFDTNGYYSEEVLTGSYILMDDIDFGGDIVRINGFSGLFEGNGYSLKNIKITRFENIDIGYCGLFKTMNGVIRNVAFEDMYFIGELNGYTPNRTYIAGRLGLVALYLQGALENVYISGEINGTVNAMIEKVKDTQTWPQPGFRLPYDDAEGEAVGGYVAYDATGGKLKNVVIDIKEQRDGVYNPTRNGDYRMNSGFSMIAGKGVPEIENVFVVEADQTTYNNFGSNIMATRGLMPSEIGVQYNTLSDKTFIDNIKKLNSNSFNIESYLSQGAGVSPLKQGAVTQDLSLYSIEHYYAANGSEDYQLFYVETEMGLADRTATGKALNNSNYVEVANHSNRVNIGTIERDGSLTLRFYYTQLQKMTSFEDIEVSANNVNKLQYFATENGWIDVVSTADAAYDLKTYFPALSTSVNKKNQSANGTQSLRFINNNPTKETTITIGLTQDQRDAFATYGALSFKMLMWSAQGKSYDLLINGMTYTIDDVAATNYVDTNYLSATWHEIALPMTKGNMDTLTITIGTNEKDKNDRFIVFIDELVVTEAPKAAYTTKIYYKYLYTNEYVDVTEYHSGSVLASGKAPVGMDFDCTEIATEFAPGGFKLNEKKSTLKLNITESGNQFALYYDQEIAMISFEDWETNENNPNKITWTEGRQDECAILTKGCGAMDTYWDYRGPNYFDTRSLGSGSKFYFFRMYATYSDRDKWIKIPLTAEMKEGLKRGGVLEFDWVATTEAENKHVTALKNGGTLVKINGEDTDIKVYSFGGATVATCTTTKTYNASNAVDYFELAIEGGVSNRFYIGIDNIRVVFPNA